MMPRPISAWQQHVVLGVDPGMRHLAYALIQRAAPRPRLLLAGTIAIEAAEEAGHRIWGPHAGSDLVSAVGIEDQRHVARGKTERGKTNYAASAVRDVQFAVAGAIRSHGIAVHFFAPVVIKATLVSARASAAQMLAAARAIFGSDITNEHEAHAVAAAWATLRRLETSHGRVAANPPALGSRSRDRQTPRVNARPQP